MAGKTNTSRRRRRTVRGIGTLGSWATATAYFCMLLLVLVTVEVSAKIRVPSPFASGESQQDNQIPTAATTTVEGSATSFPTSAASETIEAAAHESNYESAENAFQSWFQKNWNNLAASISKDESGNREVSQTWARRATDGRIYGIRLSSLSFASLTSQEYLSRIEERLQTLRDCYERAQKILSKSLMVLWKTTNDVVRYKFPVGIVTAWSAVVVARKILKVHDRQRKKKLNGGDNGDENQQDETPDTYKFVLRHTGRALDLDADDLTSYRHNGGIERVRSRLLRSVFSENNAKRRINGNEGKDEKNNEQEKEKEKLLEALLAALSMEFIPGGSHSEYIQSMIPSFAKAEEYAHKLRFVPCVVPASKGATGGGRSHRPFLHIRSNETNDAPAFEENNDDDEETQLIAMALQTAEVRILDSKLRSIRDRLIRTTYRLDRTVKYWKSKVESERLTTSLMATTTRGSWKRFALFSSSPIQRLKMRWSRLFFFGSNVGDGSSSVLHKNPNFVHNSLLEGDRMRLAFAEAAYKAEIVRLGNVLDLLSKRPEEMPDSTLTNALVEQQQDLRRKKEAELFEFQKLDEQMWNGDDDTEEGETDLVASNNDPPSFHRIRNMAAATKDRIAKTLDRNPKVEIPVVVEKKNIAMTLLHSLKSTNQKVVALWVQRREQRKNKRPKQNSFLAIRFNADGRGKFSVQTYDEGSVAIESDTAKRLLLRNYDEYQKPWLDESNAWALDARGLIVDTIREAVEASIHPLSSNSNINSGYTTHNGFGDDTANELDDLESKWRIRKYDVDPSVSGETVDETPQASIERPSNSLIPAILASKLALPSARPSSSSIPLHQWMFVYEMSRDINRLKRVGEGKSLKFKWKEVHWIHWLMQWNLVGLPSAALKIWAAMWIHNQSKPYVPKVQELSREAYAATLEILMTRFWTPFKDLVEELTSRKQKLVTGVSLEEEEYSLDIMLKDLELGDGTPATRHEATIKATRQYESYMKSGLMMHALGGRLARLMLIQMQQLKVSMLDATETMDVLFESNKINMQLLAVIPAFGIIFLGSKIFVRFLFSIRAKDLRPITSVHAEMTDYLNELEANIILRKKLPTTSPTTVSDEDDDDLEEKQQLGEFALTLYNYLLLLDYSSPQPFSSRQCDVIHRSLTTFLGKNGSFGCNRVTVDGHGRLLDNVKGKHQELSKFL